MSGCPSVRIAGFQLMTELGDVHQALNRRLQTLELPLTGV